MLYIDKRIPPKKMLDKVSEIKSSSEWRALGEKDGKAVREMFEQLPKDVIRQSLLEEQHYLCAYCMRRIKNDGMKTTIEHWYPLSADKERALDYKNMLAVCDGGRNWSGSGKRVLCCDACKADETELTISPLNKHQMSVIAYDREGFIKTSTGDEKLEDDLKHVLCLNGLWKGKKFLADTSTGLVKGRRDAYMRCKRLFEKLDHKGQCTPARIRKIVEEIENAEQRPEYAGVLLYFLNKKYQTLLRRAR